MIPVHQQPEPTDFDKKVRTKGVKFLKREPQPQSWSKCDYWRNALGDLYEVYNRVCAYSAFWIPWSVGTPTVDHFVPKSIKPELAYEWSNFRLSSLKMNARKGNYQDVLDPLLIQPGWFILDFPSLLIKPNPNLDQPIKIKVRNTIKRLKLNDDDRCVQERQSWVIEFCKNKHQFEVLKEKAPFIAYELERQNLVDTISLVMSVN